MPDTKTDSTQVVRRVRPGLSKERATAVNTAFLAVCRTIAENSSPSELCQQMGMTLARIADAGMVELGYSEEQIDELYYLADIICTCADAQRG